MDGRRLSVDIPISKTLVALSRVRSFRDPSTISTSEFSTFVDNVNWETNSSTRISLRFLDSCQEGGSGKHHGLRTKNVDCSFGEREVFIDDFKSNYGLEKSKLNFYENLGPKAIDNGRYCSNHVDKTSIIPPINPWEDVNLCNELSIGPVQEERTDHIESERKFQCKNQVKKSFGVVGDGKSCVHSPCLSLRDALSSHSASIFANEVVDFVENDDPECGISCCWSGTPRFWKLPT